MYNWLGNRQQRLKEGSSRRSPPGPQGLPLLGSMLQAKEDPLEFAGELLQEYGDIVHFKIGYYAGYLLNHPDYIRQVLVTNYSNYSKDNYNYEKLRPVLGNGLITSDGDHWRHHRQVMQPAFSRKRLGQLCEVTANITRDRVDQWFEYAAKSLPVNMSQELEKLTLQVVTESLFGTDATSSMDAIRETFSILNEDIAYRFKNVFVPPLWVPTKRNRVFSQARDTLDQIVYKIIDSRRGKAESRNDLLGNLLAAQKEQSDPKQFTDRQIRDEVMTLLLAGHETTANLLMWTFYLISRHPEVEQKVRMELDSVLDGRDPAFEDLPDLVYTKMVLQESLRLFPPVWIISRKAVRSDRIGGYDIPEGSTVTVCLYTLHRHPDFWEAPGQFQPERFAPERSEDRPQYAYLPFGGGPRSCIGKHFAMMEAQIIMAIIFRRFRLNRVSDYPVDPEPLVTLRPEEDLEFIIELLVD